jgi:ABC-type amino acid transport substrate-binding protein
MCNSFIKGTPLRLGFIIIFCFAAMACQKRQEQASAGSPTLERIQKAGTLNVGYVVYPPTVIKDPNSGELRGHFVDAIRFMADIMKVKVQFHEADFSTFVADLQNGKTDLSIAATYRTIPRAMAVAFTRPIIYIGNGAIVKAGDQRFKAVDDFNQPGLRIAVAQGEASHEYAREHLGKATLTVISTSNLSLPLAEVVAGRADVGLADAWTTSLFAREHPETVDLFAGRPYDLTPVGWAVRQDDPQWLNFINTALDYLESTGRMEVWEAKYNAHWVRPRREYVVQ